MSQSSIFKQSREPDRIDLDIKYHVDNLTNDSQRFEQAAMWVADHFHLERLSASIAIVDDPTIHELNRQHLNHDWPTDVISFVFDDGNQKVEGEVIVSSETAARLYGQAGWRHEDEILLYVVHGFLHLAGLDDQRDDEQQEMRAHEQACLVALGVPSAEEHMRRWKDIAY